ncbi:radical SAM/SPASM domain-containing protein [Aliarcobacter sp. ERUVET-7]|uniref:radical SAM/SPASM domain-containing protein n=1 Tax=Aliarcobacter sp. ERUVET-7 TaxID=3429683 RepID=UPI003D6BA935
MQENEGKYIPINKGHFELDTIERTEEFNKKMATGWENEYKEYRENWVSLPKTRNIREYPLLVDLELSSACNLKCPMCYTITDDFKKKVKKGFMDFELFKKIIDEISGKVFAIRLSLRGEATLHKNFIDCIKYAKEKGIKEVSTLTHGGNLELEFFEKAVKAGIDWITISIDGVDEEYNKIRKPLKFEDTLRRLKQIKKYKDENNLTKPVIKIQGIWPAIRPNPTKYYETIAPLVDLVSYNPLIDYLRKDSEIVYEENFACPQLYQRVVVGSDGKVMMCSNDEDGEEIVGNAYEDTIYDIWHGEKLNKIRDIHNQPDGFKTMKVCKLCYYPRKMIPDEPAKVGDRDIIVENYINRKQNAGE